MFRRTNCLLSILLLLTALLYPNDKINALFTATIQATEEAIINALIAAKQWHASETKHANAVVPVESRITPNALPALFSKIVLNCSASPIV